MSVSGARAAPTLHLIESQGEQGINKVQYGLVRDLVSWRLPLHKLDNAAGVACLQSGHLPPMQLIIQSSRQYEEAYEETPLQIMYHTRSLVALRAQTSRWRHFGPFW